MALAKGATLGPYEVLAHLGSGGMGEVWRARDRRIGRDVAVKVLPGAYPPGDERLLRFEQEARAAGSLSHPGLVTIFDVGTVGGAPYIVMELLEGETLRDVLGDREPVALPPRRAIEYAIQIASALSAAHEKGIIHRDLKPENIFVTSDKRVKILDFGLAKLAPDSTEGDGRNKTSRRLTSAGVVVGTPAYMSPEQVRAAPVNHRTDIFSLGSVLYEMISGRLAFERDSVIETMHAVSAEEPPPFEKPEISPALEAAIRHCLEKSPRERFQSARDLAFHLESLPEMQRGTSTGRNVQALRKPWRRAAVIVLPLLLAVAAGGYAVRGLRSDASLAGGRAYKQLTSADGLETLPTLAPDGKSFAYVSSQSGNRDIYVQRVDGRAAINITADFTDDDSEPAFSPDGSQIAFRSEREGGGIFLMGATGESPSRLTTFGRNPAWSPDGTKIVFATDEVEMAPASRNRDSELWVIDVRSQLLRPLVQRGKGGPDFGRESDAVQPSWSPHGQRIAFWGLSSASGQRDVWTIDPNAREPKKTVVRVTTDAAVHWNPVWSPDGKYLYYGSDRDGTMNLWRVAMNEETGAPAGIPEPVGLPAPVTGDFAFAKSGEMAYVALFSSYRVLAMPLDLNAGTIGSPRQLLGGSQSIIAYQPSPDGKMIAYSSLNGVQEDLFIAEADGTRIRQLTNDAATDRGVQWSPDGKTLYLYSNRDGNASHVWSIRADGSGLVRVSDDGDMKPLGAQHFYQPVVSPDGRTLIVQTDRETSALLHLDRPRGRRVEALPVFLPAPRWSPDGQFIVAKSRRVANIIRVRNGGGPIVLYSLQTRRAEQLADGGAFPNWTPDGKQVVFFGEKDVRIVDLATRALRTIPFPPIAGAQIDLRDGSRLSADAATLYVRQASQQSDVWMLRSGAPLAR